MRTPPADLDPGALVRALADGWGIAADRILAISKGEEQPLCMDMTEACYMMNRRGHFIITAK